MVVIYLMAKDLFNLYCTELGKPHGLICYYQNNGWLDLSVLTWVRAFGGIPLPGYLSTIFHDYLSDHDTGYIN